MSSARTISLASLLLTISIYNQRNTRKFSYHFVTMEDSKTSDEGKAKSNQNLSELRAFNANVWVEIAVEKLLKQIEVNGTKKDGAGGNDIEIKFGTLFSIYQDLSNSLLGILTRAKKRGLISYTGGDAGDLLMQRVHDEVVITMHMNMVEEFRKDLAEHPRVLKEVDATDFKKASTCVFCIHQKKIQH